MFVYRTKVRLKDTDATGVLYFSCLFNDAVEVFEEFLQDRGVPLKDWIASSIGMPVVHAEADYLAPLRVGDEVEICLTVEELGSTSVAFRYCFCDSKRNLEVGRVKMVHVVIDQKTGQPIPIPDSLKEILSPLASVR